MHKISGLKPASIEYTIPDKLFIFQKLRNLKL